jgi:hypothetical protein
VAFSPPRQSPTRPSKNCLFGFGEPGWQARACHWLGRSPRQWDTAHILRGPLPTQISFFACKNKVKAVTSGGDTQVSFCIFCVDFSGSIRKSSA